MKYYQYCNRVKNILVPILHYHCVCTPYVQESKKIRALIFNKDECKSLAHKNGNENPIWSWNDSPPKSDSKGGYKEGLVGTLLKKWKRKD